MTNNNQVNWDEIPEDVEAVVTYSMGKDTFFKKEGGKLYSQLWRHSIYTKSGWDEYNEVSEYYGDRFHLRPSPTSKPTPEPPESTQVETSEVKDTTTPEFDWSSVEEDVEAVVLCGSDTLCYKVVDGIILSKFIESTKYKRTIWKHFDSIKDVWGDSFITRPPATTPSSKNVTCKVEFYEGDLPEGMVSIDEETKLPAVFTTPEFNWDDVDDDVEVVVPYPDNTTDFYNHIDGKLYVQFKRGEQYFRSDYDTVSEMFEDYDEGRVLIRPLPETTTHDEPPSIPTILQEAQQSILKHHGVTGKVTFTVSVGE